jgi:hypothetical protein
LNKKTKLKNKRKKIIIITSRKFLLILGPKVLSFLATNFEVAIFHLEFQDSFIIIFELFLFKYVLLCFFIDLFCKSFYFWLQSFACQLQGIFIILGLFFFLKIICFFGFTVWADYPLKLRGSGIKKQKRLVWKF